MNARLTHHHLLSLAASAMISASFLATAPSAVVSAATGPQPAAILGALDALRSAGFHGTQNLVLPSPSVNPQSSTAQTPAPAAELILTEARLKTLDKDFAAFGVNAFYLKEITDALGLTHGAEKLAIRQLTVGIKGPDGLTTIHGLTRVAGTDSFLLTVQTEGAVPHFYTYLIDGKQELVAGIDKVKGVPGVAIPVAKAQATVKAELAFWADIADKT